MPAHLEPDLRLETRVVSVVAGPSHRRIAWLLPASFFLHVAVALTAAVSRLLMPEPLPLPASGVRAFLVEPPVATPPPPPPAPAPKAIATQRVADPPADRAKPVFTAPRDVPERIVTNEPLDVGMEAGEVGGVEGGVPGGVVGGIVGGLPATPPAPPPPVRLEKGVKEPKKLKHVAPRYPEIAARANIRGTVLLDCWVSPQGRVTEVKVLKSSNPLLDDAAIEAVKQWVYTPTLVDGVPVAVIFVVTVRFDLQ